MAAVLHHTVKNAPELRFTLSFTVPFGQDRGWYFYVLAELLWRMTAQKQPIKKGRFTLRHVEIGNRIDLRGNELWHRVHKKEIAVYRKKSQRQVEPGAFCNLPINRGLHRYFPLREYNTGTLDRV